MNIQKKESSSSTDRRLNKRRNKISISTPIAGFKTAGARGEEERRKKTSDSKFDMIIFKP